MPSGPIKITPAQKAGTIANNTARSGLLSGAKNADFVPNNSTGFGGMNKLTNPLKNPVRGPVQIKRGAPTRAAKTSALQGFINKK